MSHMWVVSIAWLVGSDMSASEVSLPPVRHLNVRTKLPMASCGLISEVYQFKHEKQMQAGMV